MAEGKLNKQDFVKNYSRKDEAARRELYRDDLAASFQRAINSFYSIYKGDKNDVFYRERTEALQMALLTESFAIRLGFSVNGSVNNSLLCGFYNEKFDANSLNFVKVKSTNRQTLTNTLNKDPFQFLPQFEREEKIVNPFFKSEDNSEDIPEEKEPVNTPEIKVTFSPEILKIISQDKHGNSYDPKITFNKKMSFLKGDILFNRRVKRISCLADTYINPLLCEKLGETPAKLIKVYITSKEGKKKPYVGGDWGFNSQKIINISHFVRTYGSFESALEKVMQDPDFKAFFEKEGKEKILSDIAILSNICKVKKVYNRKKKTEEVIKKEEPLVIKTKEEIIEAEQIPLYLSIDTYKIIYNDFINNFMSGKHSTKNVLVFNNHNGKYGLCEDYGKTINNGEEYHLVWVLKNKIPRPALWVNRSCRLINKSNFARFSPIKDIESVKKFIAPPEL